MDFWDWLGIAGSIGSIFGFAGTIWAYLQQRSLKKRYALLLRGPQLLEGLRDHASQINELLLEGFKENKQAIAHELRQARTFVHNLADKVDRKTHRELRVLLSEIDRQQPDLTERGIRYVSRRIPEIATAVEHHTDDVKAGM